MRYGAKLRTYERGALTRSTHSAEWRPPRGTRLQFQSQFAPREITPNIGRSETAHDTLRQDDGWGRELLNETRAFAAAVQGAFARLARGQPEEQLKRPVSEYIEAAGRAFGIPVDTTAEIAVSNGRPDIGVLTNGLLCGHVELKAPRETVDPAEMRGRNKEQWQKFSALPNLIYTNSREWRLYQRGELIGAISFEGEPRDVGDVGVSAANAERLSFLLRAFLNWTPIVPTRPLELARFLAPLTRILRDDVSEAVRANSESLIGLRDEWRAYLFPDFSDAEFADAYAQTVASALLLARLEGADVTNPANAEEGLRAQNSLLGRILRILTQEEVREEIKLGLSILERVIQALNAEELQAAAPDPWLYFYEDFLHAYDPGLARDAGVYYTPAQIVRCQVRLVSQLLEQRFAKPYSFASEGVTVLDPAVGTGTYLVAAIQHALEIVEARAGAQRPARAAELAKNLIGFELLIGPYAVAHLRLNRELISAAGPGGGDPLQDQPLRVYLADTLESPVPPGAGALVPLMHRPLVQERENARRVKADEQVIVCIGNPPYDRQMEEGAARKGGWVRFGDHTQQVPILEDFLEPARRAGEGVNLRSIYNDYVYFWRWALWKVFETRPQDDQSPGIVSFITGSSYLAGPGFVGMREYMRRCFDEIWIIDLGGDSLGTRREPNVFAIQTPVTIAIGVRGPAVNWDAPATVHYQRISGTRAEKLQQLEAVRRFADLNWRECPADWQAPFKPALGGAYAAWPAIGQLFPWQHNGAQFVRTWPIAPTQELLQRRWTELLAGDEAARRVALKETRDRTIDWTSDRVAMPGAGEACLADLAADAPCPRSIRYAYRSFDRQWALYDARLGDYLKAPIWAAHSAHQIYLGTLLATAIGFGPAATFAANIPDLHHFRGSFGGKDLIPLYRDPEGLRPNITAGLLDGLSANYDRQVRPEDLFCYVAGVLGGRAYVARFWTELDTPGVRVPIAKSGAVFDRAVALGRRYINLATFNERFAPAEPEPPGRARVVTDIPHTADRYPDAFSYDEEWGLLTVGDGVIGNVSAAVWSYEVSGLSVVDSWLAYRMRRGAGRTSSPLDALRPRAWTAGMTEELLEVLWALERYVALEPEAREVLDAVLAGDIFLSADLPQPTAAERAEPRVGAVAAHAPLI
jgi:hypothetical protein